MTDEGRTTNERDEKESGNDTTAFLAIGITFLFVALATGAAQGNWTMAIPFLGVGITFSILGLGRRGPERASRGKGPDEADE